jgi:hypothetical protein
MARGEQHAKLAKIALWSASFACNAFNRNAEPPLLPMASARLFISTSTCVWAFSRPRLSRPGRADRSEYLGHDFFDCGIIKEAVPKTRQQLPLKHIATLV